MKKLDGITSDEELPSVIAELEELSENSPSIRLGALHILKNELGELDLDAESRGIEYERRFLVPGSLWHKARRALRGPDGGLGTACRRLAADFGAWLRRDDSEGFRDRCDQTFFEQIVPEIDANFGDLAGPMNNTINEAIINYAEYSFKRYALGRRIAVHMFKTEGNLGYAIVRPLGTRLRAFDPLALKKKHPTELHKAKRGWGFTIMMERALFISFDRAERMRGMMVIVGPE